MTQSVFDVQFWLFFHQTETALPLSSKRASASLEITCTSSIPQFYSKKVCEIVFSAVE